MPYLHLSYLPSVISRQTTSHFRHGPLIMSILLDVPLMSFASFESGHMKGVFCVVAQLACPVYRMCSSTTHDNSILAIVVFMYWTASRNAAVASSLSINQSVALRLYTCWE